MGILNLLKGSYTGRVGETVGAKWKNKHVVRVHTKPSYSDTPAQQLVREWFAGITAFCALFTDPLKSLSAMDTRGMSLRNSIIALNKDTMGTVPWDPATLRVSRGGLPQPTGEAFAAPAGLSSITATWTPATGVNVSDKARFVVVAVDKTSNFAAVGSALNSAGTLSIATEVPASKTIHVYSYLLDYRGSSKVASQSSHTTITSPAS